jgi:hypothetical protein
MYVPNFINIGSGIEKLIRGKYTYPQKNRQDGNRISLLLFFQDKGTRLKIIEI